MTTQNKGLLQLFNKGYTISKEGNIINPSGKKLKGTLVDVRKGELTYRCVNTRVNGIKTFVKVHRLQAYQKYGNKLFDEGIVVRHKNGNSLDNSWDNIHIGTQSDNQKDIPKEKRVERASNPKHNHLAIIRDKQKGMSYKEIMLKYNISSKGTVSFIINKSFINNKDV